MSNQLPRFNLFLYETGDMIAEHDIAKLHSLYKMMYRKYAPNQRLLDDYFNWFMVLSDDQLKKIGLVREYESSKINKYSVILFRIDGDKNTYSEDYSVITKYDDNGSIGYWVNYYHATSGTRHDQPPTPTNT